MVWAMQCTNVQKTLQFINVVHQRLIDLLLGLVVDRVEVRLFGGYRSSGLKEVMQCRVPEEEFAQDFAHYGQWLL